MRRPALLLLLPSILGAACAAPAPALPTHPLLAPADTSRAIADRAATVRSIESACNVVMRDEDGDRVVLDGALVAEMPSRLRLRAWKFNTAVLDVTLVDGGLWVAGAAGEGDDPAAALRAEDIVRAWSILDGGYFAADPDVVEADDATIVYASAPDADGGRIRAVVDRPTRTVRRYVVVDADGTTQRTIDLDRYRLVGEVAWPHRLRFGGAEGAITIEMHDVRINEPPLQHAFDPPRDAVRRQ